MTMEQLLFKYADTVITGIALLGAAFAIVAALNAGVLKKITLGPFQIEAQKREFRDASDLLATAAVPGTEPLPFETEQLALYYAQILYQAKVSFWFSLVFASLGFAVIVLAAFRYSDQQAGSSVATFVAGIIMDAVAALFFVQSKSAQTSMGQFFDKLRRDRQHAESRRLCDTILDDRVKDSLKLLLALHYAEVAEPANVADMISRTVIPSKLATEKAET